MDKKATILFLLFGFAFLLLAFVEEGGKPLTLLAPTAAMIVFGGTIGAVGVAFPFEELKHLKKALGVIFNFKPKNLMKEIDIIKNLSAKTRREGLLSLENELKTTEDPFLRKGLQLMIDGIDKDTLEAILENDLALTQTRHKVACEIMEAAGGYSPTMGVVGTVMGLISVLSNLENPSELGRSIALAFIATLYGVAFANLVYLPLGAKLKAFDKINTYEKQFMIESILLLHEGTPTTLIEEKLKSYLHGTEQIEYEQHKKHEKTAAT